MVGPPSTMFDIRIKLKTAIMRRCKTVNNIARTMRVLNAKLLVI